MFKRKYPKPRKGAWFIPVRWSYLPASPQGWALYVPYALYLMVTFLWVYQRSTDPLSMTLELIPYWIAGVVVMQWIAAHKS